MDRKSSRPCENLANAIILQAVTDYRAALKDLIGNPRDKAAQYTKTEVERFFYSGWFSALTDVDGKWLSKKLRKEAGV